MSARYFIDTNVLVYAAIASPEDEHKRLRAFEVIDDGDFATSAQVHAEFAVAVRRRGKPPMQYSEINEWLMDIAKFPVEPITVELVARATEIADRYAISYWDGAILAAAEAQGAQVLYSEDLNDGQKYESVRVVNPFLGS